MTGKEFRPHQNSLRTKIMQLRKTADEHRWKVIEAEKQISELMQYCDHAHTKHHAGATAECGGWDECEICGKQL